MAAIAVLLALSRRPGRVLADASVFVVVVLFTHVSLALDASDSCSTASTR